MKKEERNCNGFSLIELMIVLLIISIMAIYSYPSYKNYIIKVRRIDGKTALYDLANRLDNYYSLNNTYESASIAENSINDILSSPYSPEGWYALSIVEATSSTFLIQATPQKKQAIDDVICRTYTLTNTGIRGANNTTTSINELKKCW
jgi:type IV pilus assembly protein PilE